MKIFEAPSASKLVLQTILVRGGAFRAKYEFLNEGLKDRIFVVGNLSPATDDRIILFSATTQITKRREHHKDRASLVLVDLNPSIYDGVTETCVLDCESPIKRARTEFMKHVEDRRYRPLAIVPDTIMAKIVAAVRAARTLSSVEKRLILGS